MNILVLASTYPRRQNDTEPKFVDSLCRYLARDNVLHVVAPHDCGIPTREVIAQNLEVFRFRYAPERWETLAYNGGILPNLKQKRLKFLLVPFFVFGQILLAIKLVRRNRYDVIHAHWIIPQGFIAIIARLFAHNAPAIVLTSHGGDLFALKGRVLSALKRWIINASDHLTVVSSAMLTAARALGIADKKISIISMGVDSHHTFFPADATLSRAGLIFIGRLVNKKGIEYLLEALPLVLATHPEQHLTIIGDGPLKPSLLALCDATGITKFVTFAGSLPNEDIPAYLQKSAIAIIPSVVTENGDQEGAPVAIMETLACACPTIVSDYPGARDIIVDGENGLLVPQRSAQDIAEKINYLLENPASRERLAHRGRESVQNRFDWQVIGAAFQAVFNKFSAAAKLTEPALAPTDYP
jgi:glycosyltransferase involved in cell wall biosynthesis